MTAVGPGAAEGFFESLSQVDPQRASRLVLDLLDDGVPVARICEEVLRPAQVRVGQMWEQGEWGVADEHAATAVTESAVVSLTAAVPRPRPARLHVAVACAEGEWHTLPARMLGAVAQAGGAQVTVLGPSMPAAHLGDRLAAGDVDVLAVSCTLPTNLVGAARSVGAAHDAGVPVVVGGRAFSGREQRAWAIGADAFAEDAAALLGPPPALAGRPVVVPHEVLLLDDVHPDVVDLALDRLVAAHPQLARREPHALSSTREDLRWMARYAGAAVLTGDATVLDELLQWLVRLRAGRVPREVVATSARLVAETVEPSAPRGAELLTAAAARCAAVED